MSQNLENSITQPHSHTTLILLECTISIFLSLLLHICTCTFLCDMCFFWKWKQLFMFIDVAGNMLLCVQCGRGRDSLGWPRPVYRSILVLRQQGKGGRRWWETDIFQFRQIYFAFGEILFAIETFGPKLNPSVHPHIRKERGGCEWWIKGPRVHLPTLPPPPRIYLWDEIMVLFVHPLSQIIKLNPR